MKINNRTLVMVAGVIILLTTSYFLGSHSQKSDEIIIPTTQVQNVSGVVSEKPNQISGGVYDYTEAGSHIGENATIRGTVVDVYTSKTGTTFIDFCKSYKTCPFTAVIFSSKSANFPNVKQYSGQNISISGTIAYYQGKAEIIIESPSQIGK